MLYNLEACAITHHNSIFTQLYFNHFHLTNYEEKMKKLSLISALLVFLVFGCSSNKEKNTSQDKTITHEQNIAKNKKDMPPTKNKVAEKNSKILTSAVQYNGTMDAKAIIISNFKQSKPIDFQGSKATAVTMPDGSMWEAKIVDGKNMIVMPDGKLIQEKMVDGKMELITDNNKVYQVKVIDGKMVAISSNNSATNLASR
jgi:hypothetical protein